MKMETPILQLIPGEDPDFVFVMRALSTPRLDQEGVPYVEKTLGTYVAMHKLPAELQYSIRSHLESTDE